MLESFFLLFPSGTLSFCFHFTQLLSALLRLILACHLTNYDLLLRATKGFFFHIHVQSSCNDRIAKGKIKQCSGMWAACHCDDAPCSHAH